MPCCFVAVCIDPGQVRSVMNVSCAGLGHAPATGAGATAAAGPAAMIAATGVGAMTMAAAVRASPPHD